MNTFLLFSLTEAIHAVVITGIIWLFLTILMRFALPGIPSFLLSLVLAACFIILPIVNHIGIFIAIRRHNNQVADAFSGHNLSVIFRREKKAAIDMFIVMALLILFLAPALFVNLFKGLLGDKFEILYAWASGAIYLNSSINPVVYSVRNREIRNALKSIMSI